ncbi:MAG: PAS domain-containing protein, partial [Acidimicrobiales bacterium]
MGALGWIVTGVLLVALLVTLLVALRLRDRAARLPDLEREFHRVRERATEHAAAEDKLRRALDAIPQGVVIGDEHGRVSYRNAIAAEYL